MESSVLFKCTPDRGRFYHPSSHYGNALVQPPSRAERNRSIPPYRNRSPPLARGRFGSRKSRERKRVLLPVQHVCFGLRRKSTSARRIDFPMGGECGGFGRVPDDPALWNCVRPLVAKRHLRSWIDRSHC